MTNTAWIIDASSGSPSYPAQAIRQALSNLLGNGSSRVLGARSGYVQGRQPTTLTVTSTTYTIGQFAAIVDAAFTTSQAPYLIAADANNTGSITAAAGSARIDILCAQVNDTAVDSSGSRNFTVTYTAGTAGSGVPPSTPARSFVLATISVPASGGGSPTIAVNNTFAVAAGGILPVTAQSAAPSAGIVEGNYIDDATNNGLFRYNGSGFVPTGSFVSGSGGAVTVSAIVSTNIVPSSGSQAVFALTGWASAPVMQVTLLTTFDWYAHMSSVTSTQVNVFVKTIANANLADNTAVSFHVTATGIPSAGSVPTV